MNVTVCDLCGDIIEVGKKPRKGLCFCGSCLGTLAAMVEERNKPNCKIEKDADNAPLTVAEDKEPEVKSLSPDEYALNVADSIVYGDDLSYLTFLNECDFIGKVMRDLEKFHTYEVFPAPLIETDEPKSTRAIRLEKAIKECNDRLGIYSQRPTADKSDADNGEEDSADIEEPAPEPEVENSISEQDTQERMAAEKKQDTAPPPKRKKRVKIDHGRVVALHNAGWSNRQIADEVNASYDAVANILTRARKAGEHVMTPKEIAADKFKRNRII